MKNCSKTKTSVLNLILISKMCQDVHRILQNLRHFWLPSIYNKENQPASDVRSYDFLFALLCGLLPASARPFELLSTLHVDSTSVTYGHFFCGQRWDGDGASWLES